MSRRVISSRLLACLLGLCLPALSVSAQEGRWEVAVSDSIVSISWDRATLVRFPEGIVRVWIRSDFLRPRRIGGSDSTLFQRTINRVDLDCAKSISRTVQANWYTVNGSLIRSSDAASAWTELVPTGHDSRSLVAICAAQRTEGTALTPREAPPTAPSVSAPVAATAPIEARATSPFFPAAQPAAHKGFHAAVGLGYGSAGIECDACSADRESNLSLMLRFGGAVAPGIVLSGEISSWSKQLSGATASMAFVTFVAQLYPNPAEGFYVKLGLGGASGQETVLIRGYGSAVLNVSSLGLEGGTGFDFPLTPTFSLTPFIDLFTGTPSSVTVNGATGSYRVSTSLIHFGIAASWR